MLRRLLALPWVHTAYDVLIVLVVVSMAWQYESIDRVVGVLMALTLLFRRQRPMTVMLVVTWLALAQTLFAVDIAAFDVALLVAMVSVVTHTQVMWHAHVAGGIVLASTVLTLGGLLPHTDREAEPLFDIVAFGGVSAAVWLTAVVLRTRRLYVASLEERAATAEREREHLVQLAAAEERAEIARELHDVVAHSLAVMILQADGAGYVLKSDPEKAGSALKAIGDTGRDALDDMHRIVKVLRGGRNPAQDADADRRKVSLDDLETVAERARSAGLDVELDVQGERSGLSTADQLTVLRVVQESLTNVLRHAGPGAHVAISLRFAGAAVTVQVIDDGGGRLAGPGAGGERPNGGNGLVGMRERLEVSGGTFTAGPRMGAGWQVEARLPLGKPSAAPAHAAG